MPEKERRLYLRNRVSDMAASVLGVEIEPNQSLLDTGVDSMSAVELPDRIEEEIGIHLPSSLIFDYPTIDEIAGLIEGEIMGDSTMTQGFKWSDMVRKEVDPAERAAILGAHGVFPGEKRSVGKFWAGLLEGYDAITVVPKTRWDVDVELSQYRLADGSPLRYQRHAAFMDGIEYFDNDLFGLTYDAADALDPQQRMLMESGYVSIHATGYKAIDENNILFGSDASIYIGAVSTISTDLFFLNMSSISAANELRDLGEDRREGLRTDDDRLSAYNNIAPRVAYQFGFKGPVMTIDTASSSAMVALLLGIDSARATNEVSLVGGLHMLLHPSTWIAPNNGMWPMDGRIKSFDEKADGWSQGEVVGTMLTSTLALAEERGCAVNAIIMGSALKNDGRVAVFGFINAQAIRQLIKESIVNSSIIPNDMVFNESVGLGVPVADMLEINAVSDVLSQDRSSAYCDAMAVGSVHSNIGHAGGGSGFPAFLKSVNALIHGVTPPIAHLGKLSPNIRLEKFLCQFPRIRSALPSNQEQSELIGGCTSFGLGGSKIHLVLRGVTKDTVKNPLEYVTNLSCKEQAVVLAISTQDGAITTDMAYDVYQVEPAFRKAIWKCTRMVQPLLPRLLRLLYPSATQPDDATASEGLTESTRAIPRTRSMMERISSLTSMGLADLSSPSLSTQSSLFSEVRDSAPETIESGMYCGAAKFALCLAGIELLASKGVVPDVIVGTHLGVYIAAYMLGVIQLRDAMKLALIRQHDGPSTKLRMTWYNLTLGKANATRYLSAKTGELVEKEDLQSVEFWLFEDGLDDVEDDRVFGDEGTIVVSREICETVSNLFAHNSVIANIGNRLLITQDEVDDVCGRDVIYVVPMLQMRPTVTEELGKCTTALERVLELCGPGHAIRPIRFNRSVYPLAVWEPSKTSDKRMRTEALNMLLNSETSRSGIGVTGAPRQDETNAPPSPRSPQARIVEPVVDVVAVGSDSATETTTGPPTSQIDTIDTVSVQIGSEQSSPRETPSPTSSLRRPPQSPGSASPAARRLSFFTRRENRNIDDDNNNNDDTASIASSSSSPVAARSLQVTSASTPTSMSRRLGKTIGKSLSKARSVLPGAFGACATPPGETDARDDQGDEDDGSGGNDRRDGTTA